MECLMNCETDQLRIHINVWNVISFFEPALIPYHSKSNCKYNFLVRSVLTSLCIIKLFTCESSISTTPEFSWSIDGRQIQDL